MVGNEGLIDTATSVKGACSGGRRVAMPDPVIGTSLGHKA